MRRRRAAADAMTTDSVPASRPASPLPHPGQRNAAVPRAAVACAGKGC